MNAEKVELYSRMLSVFEAAVSTGNIQSPSEFMLEMMRAAHIFEESITNSEDNQEAVEEATSEKTMPNESYAPQIVRIPSSMAYGMLKSGRDCVDMVELNGRTYLLREIYPTSCRFDCIHIVVVICDDKSGQLYMANFALGMDLRSNSDFGIIDGDDNVIFRKAKAVKKSVLRYEYES